MRKRKQEPISVTDLSPRVLVEGTAVSTLFFKAVTVATIPAFGLSAGVTLAVVLTEWRRAKKLRRADAEKVVDVIRASLKEMGQSEKQIEEFLVVCEFVDKKGRAKLPSRSK